MNTTSGDIFRSSGFALVINELFLISAAGIGAAFASLFTANRYIANGTYDPKYESSYWVRFVLGLIAGMVLAVLVPLEPNGQSFTRPLLALLGGFSASVVYRILTRLVDTLESLVRGDRQEIAAAREQAMRAHAEEQKLQERLRLGTSLLELRERVIAATSVDEVKAKLDATLSELAPIDPASGADLFSRLAAEPSGDEDLEQASAPDSAPPTLPRQAAP